MKTVPRHNPKKRMAFVLLTVCTALLCACSGGSDTDIPGVASVTDVAVSMDIDTLFEERLPGPSLPPNETPDETFCTDYTAQGLLRVCYFNDSGKKIKLEVMHDGDLIRYNLNGAGGIEDFPLQYGDGEYTVRIMEQIEGDQYYAVEYTTFDVTLEDENRVYLNSVQNVNWDYEMQPIQDVRYIVASSLEEDNTLLPSCTEDIYDYVVQNIRYDSAKVFDLLYNYLPDIVDTYTTGEGICYDYASLFAAMLRSIGIPAKLVKGYASYAPDTYHAWNEVLLGGEWITIDPTRDASLHVSGTASDMQKEDTNYTKVYEY